MADRPATNRTCPGEKAPVSLAICRTRQRNHYPKCLLCRHRSGEIDDAVSTDAKVSPTIFRAHAILGEVPGEINEYVIRKIGLSAAQFMRAETPGGSRMAVACDARENSRGFARIFCEGANSGGMDTINMGPVPPEMLAFALGTDGCIGAAFVGGGNLAENVNGVRLWRGDASPVGFHKGLDSVGLLARRMRTGRSRLPGEMTHSAPTADYTAYVRKFAPKLAPLKAVVHAGCGAAGRLLQAVLGDMPIALAPLGFGESVREASLGEPFPSRDVVAAVAAKARSEKPDFGAAIDFAGERIVFFDERGRLLRAGAAAGLIARELLARTPRATIAHDLRLTMALPEGIAAAGGKAVPGPTDPIAFAQHFRRTEALYGADAAGLHHFRGFFRFPSPVIALLVFASWLSRNDGAVSDLAADLHRFEQSGEISVHTSSPEAAESAMAAVREEYRNAPRELIDGVTIHLDGWWFNLRQSGKTGELRLNVEGTGRREARAGRQAVERIIARALSAEPRA